MWEPASEWIDWSWEILRIRTIWVAWRLPAAMLFPGGAIFVFWLKDTTPKWRRILFGTLAVIGLLLQAVSLAAYLSERFLP